MLSREEGLELVREACDELEGWVALLGGRFRASQNSRVNLGMHEAPEIDPSILAVVRTKLGKADVLPRSTGLEGAGAG